MLAAAPARGQNGRDNEAGEAPMAEHDIEDVDLLVVGGGKAGKSLAMDRAKAGERVVLVERDKIGGSCINVACIPTKALVAAAQTLLTARHAEQLGIVGAGSAAASMGGLRDHKDGVVGGMVEAHRQLFADSGMDFVMGVARFVGDRTVDIALDDEGFRRIRGRDVVINTGTVPALPELDGIGDVGAQDSESILQLSELPESLIVIGGGYVGCEFASMFAIFGAEVTLLQRGDQVLPREDPDIAEEVATLLRAHGVAVRTGAHAEEVRRERSGDVVVTLAGGAELRAGQLLCATGRSPVTAGLGLDATGVRLTDGGYVVADDHLRTTADHVWAAGDVAGSPQFTHASWNDFRILKANLTGGDAVTTGRLMPYTVFVTPELGRVGLTETQAREQGRQTRVAKIPAAAIPRSKTQRSQRGLWKAVVDADSDEILGAALLGDRAGEVIAAVQMAMLGGLRYQQVRDAPITHPTMAEGLNLLFDAL